MKDKISTKSSQKDRVMEVQGVSVRVIDEKSDQYICLTDISKKFGGNDLIKNWLRTKTTIEFLGI